LFILVSLDPSDFRSTSALAILLRRLFFFFYLYFSVLALVKPSPQFISLTPPCAPFFSPLPLSVSPLWCFHSIRPVPFLCFSPLAGSGRLPLRLSFFAQNFFFSPRRKVCPGFLETPCGPILLRSRAPLFSWASIFLSKPLKPPFYLPSPLTFLIIKISLSFFSLFFNYRGQVRFPPWKSRAHIFFPFVGPPPPLLPANEDPPYPPVPEPVLTSPCSPPKPFSLFILFFM